MLTQSSEKSLAAEQTNLLARGYLFEIYCIVHRLNQLTEIFNYYKQLIVLQNQLTFAQKSWLNQHLEEDMNPWLQVCHWDELERGQDLMAKLSLLDISALAIVPVISVNLSVKVEVPTENKELLKQLSSIKSRLELKIQDLKNKKKPSAKTPEKMNLLTNALELIIKFEQQQITYAELIKQFEDLTKLSDKYNTLLKKSKLPKLLQSIWDDLESLKSLAIVHEQKSDEAQSITLDSVASVLNYLKTSLDAFQEHYDEIDEQKTEILGVEIFSEDKSSETSLPATRYLQNLVLSKTLQLYKDEYRYAIEQYRAPTLPDLEKLAIYYNSLPWLIELRKCLEQLTNANSLVDLSNNKNAIIRLREEHRSSLNQIEELGNMENNIIEQVNQKDRTYHQFSTDANAVTDSDIVAPITKKSPTPAFIVLNASLLPIFPELVDLVQQVNNIEKLAQTRENQIIQAKVELVDEPQKQRSTVRFKFLTPTVFQSYVKGNHSDDQNIYAIKIQSAEGKIKNLYGTITSLETYLKENKIAYSSNQFTLFHTSDHKLESKVATLSPPPKLDPRKK